MGGNSQQFSFSSGFRASLTKLQKFGFLEFLDGNIWFQFDGASPHYAQNVGYH